MTDKEILEKILTHTNNLALSLELMLAEYRRDRNPTLFIQKIPFIIAALEMLPEEAEAWRSNND